VLVRTEETAARLRPSEIREKTREAEAAAIREKNQKDEATIPVDGDMDVTQELARLGKPMLRTTFVQRLKKLNAHLHYETSIRDSSIGGIYYVHPKPYTDNGERRQFICRCETTFMPEFHIYKPRYEERPDPDIKGHMTKVPTVDEMVWGWRTVLARLIRGRFLTQAAVDKEFGLPSKDSSRWQMLTGQTLG